MESSMKLICPTFCGTVALVFSLLFSFMCQSFKFEGNTFTLMPGTPTNFTIQVDDLEFSPWYTRGTQVTEAYISDGTLYVQSRDTCFKLDEEYDSKWLFARAATIITVTLGGLLLLMVCVAPCAGGIAAKIWHCSAVCFILICSLFQGLTFLMFKSDACEDNPIKKMLTDQVANIIGELESKTGITFDGTDEFLNGPGLWKDECSWDVGSSLNVVSIVCWFLAGAFMLVLGAPTEGGDADAAPAEKEVEAGKEEPQEQPVEPEDNADEDKKGNEAGEAEADAPAQPTDAEA